MRLSQFELGWLACTAMTLAVGGCMQDSYGTKAAYIEHVRATSWLEPQYGHWAEAGFAIASVALTCFAFSRRIFRRAKAAHDRRPRTLRARP